MLPIHLCMCQRLLIPFGYMWLSGHSNCTTNVYKLDAYGVAGWNLVGGSMRPGYLACRLSGQQISHH